MVKNKSLKKSIQKVGVGYMGEVEDLLKTALKLIEFAIVGAISYNVASTAYVIVLARRSMEYGFDVSLASVIKWIVFFLCLYIYYQYVKVKLEIKI